MLVRPILVGTVILLSSATAHGIVTDPVGDFLPSYTGPRGADLDVVTTEVFFNDVTQTFSFTATMAGAVGTTQGGLYVFGLNRGEGTERFTTGQPPIGAGVLFDLVLILRPDGTGNVSDIVGGGNSALPAGSITIFRNTITTAELPLSLFPSRGFGAEGYTFNLWPRGPGSGNVTVSDFAPDASNAAVTVVPAPGVAAVLSCGTFLRGRRRR